MDKCIDCGASIERGKRCGDCAYKKNLAAGRQSIIKRDNKNKQLGYVEGLERLLDYVENDCLLKESHGKEVSYKISCKIRELLDKVRDDGLK